MPCNYLMVSSNFNSMEWDSCGVVRFGVVGCSSWNEEQDLFHNFHPELHLFNKTPSPKFFFVYFLLSSWISRPHVQHFLESERMLIQTRLH
jgi:hypothetical protein